MSETFSRDAKITRGDQDFDVEVEYQAVPYERQTRDDPAAGGFEAIIAVTLDGQPFELTPAEEAQLAAYLADHHEPEEDFEEDDFNGD